MRKKLCIVFAILLLGNMAGGGSFSGSSHQGIFTAGVRAEAATEATIKNEKELITLLYQTLLNREEQLTIKHTLTSYRMDLNNLLTKVYAIDEEDTALDGDYMRYSLTRWGYSGTRIGKKTTLNFEFTYKTSLEEEKAVTKEVKRILKELKLAEATDYEKVKAIHNYIIDHVSYDDTLKKASAYDALVDQEAVCEGYSMLAYRMFTEAGIPCRIIAGTGNGVPHAWNIVRIKDEWYNIDLTWDDPITPDGKPVLVYDFFLKSTKDFVKHKRSKEYNTKAFVKAYPIASTSYPLE